MAETRISNIAGIEAPTEFIYTHKEVIDAYEHAIRDIFLATRDLFTRPESDIDSLLPQLNTAVNQLKNLFLNGLTTSSGEKKYLTAEMAGNLENFFGILKALRVDFSDPSADVALVSDQIILWKNSVADGGAYDPNSMFNIQALTKAVSDAQYINIQSLIELQYVRDGNILLESQLSSLKTALGITKSTLDNLAELQRIHNLIEVDSKPPFADTFDFNNPQNYASGYIHAASSYYGTAIVPRLTESLYTGGYEPVTIPSDNTYILGPELQSALSSIIKTMSLYGNNLPVSQTVVSGTSQSIAPGPVSDPANQINWHRAGDTYGLHQGDNTNQWFDDNGTVYPNLLPSPNDYYNDTDYNIYDPDVVPWNYNQNNDLQNGGVTFPTLVNGKAQYDVISNFSLRVPDPSNPGQDMPGFTLGDTYQILPDGNYSPEFCELYGFQKGTFYVHIPKNPQTDWAGHGEGAPDPTQSQYDTVQRTYYYIDTSNADNLTKFQNFQRDVNNLKNVLTAPMFHVSDSYYGVEGTANWMTVINPYLNNSSPTLNASKINVPKDYGIKFDPTSGFTTSIEFSGMNNAIQELVRLKATLLSAVHYLSGKTPRINVNSTNVSGIEDPNSLLGTLRVVYNNLNDTLKTGSGQVISTNTSVASAFSAFRKWMIDNYDVSNVSQQGIFQQNITTAITAGQSLNDTQKEAVRRYLYVFEEYYKSASAILTAITQIIQKMAQNIRGG